MAAGSSSSGSSRIWFLVKSLFLTSHLSAVFSHGRDNSGVSWSSYKGTSFIGLGVYVLVTQSCPILCNLTDCSPPGSSAHGIYWSGLPFPTPGDLPDPGIEPLALASPALAGGFFTMAPLGKCSWIRATPFWPHWTFVMSSKALSPNAATWGWGLGGLGFQYMNLGGDTEIFKISLFWFSIWNQGNEESEVQSFGPNFCQ